MEKKIVPRVPEAYEFVNVVSSSDGFTMCKAKLNKTVCKDKQDETILVKIIDMDSVEDVYNLANDISVAKQCCQHENIQGVHASFKVENKLWVVMPLVSTISLKSMMLSKFPYGFSEKAVSFLLFQTLKALDFLHEHKLVHANVDCDNLFVDRNLNIKLGFPTLANYKPRISEENIPCWRIDPDLIQDWRKPRNQKSDIWMVGLLVLELFYGPKNFGNEEPVEVMKPKSKNYFSCLQTKICLSGCFAGNSNERKLPELLGEVVRVCLCVDPSKRPSTGELLKHKLFNNCSSSDSHVKDVLRKLYKE